MKKLFAILLLSLSVSAYANQPKIDAVYMAQTHVQAIYFNPEDLSSFRTPNPYFKLIGNRDALIKVHITAPYFQGSAQSAPSKTQIVYFCQGEQKIIDLVGPDTLPITIPVNPADLVHSTDNAFTAIIPGECIEANKFNIGIHTNYETVSLSDAITVGAPSELHLNVYHFDLFRKYNRTMTPGWEKALESRLPIAKLNVSEASALFSRIVIPANNANPPRIMHYDPEDSRLPQIGTAWHTELNTSGHWQDALHLAAGTEMNKRMYATYVGYNRARIRKKGKAAIGGFRARSTGGEIGLLHHELGHGFSLPDWGGNYNGCSKHSEYPYKTPIDGVQVPNTCGNFHAGPTWGYDQAMDIFVEPRFISNGISYFKKDPMRGGGLASNDPAVLLRHFSDYSTQRIQNHFEKNLARWDASLEKVVAWDSNSGSYTRVLNPRKKNYIWYPIQSNVDTVSIMTAVDRKKGVVSLVYPPVGPYNSGVIQLFDPTNSDDRALAQANNFCKTRCDFSLRVLQGGIWKTYMLNISLDTSLGDAAWNRIETKAINLLAKNGPVTHVELIKTPNANIQGLPDNPTRLAYWPEAVDKSNWSVESSGVNSLAGADNNRFTQWQSNTPQAPGQFFTIEMDQPYSINSVVLDSRNHPDHYPRGYQISTSLDGHHYTPVTEGVGTGAINKIFFDTTTTQYIRISLTKAHNAHWSIDEVDVYYDLTPNAVMDGWNTVPVVPNPPITDTNDVGVTFSATDFDRESHPDNDNIVRDMKSKVGYIKHNSWIAFEAFNFGSGAKRFTVNASTPRNYNGTVSIRIDRPDAPPIASIVVSNTGGWSTFSTLSTNIPNISGVKDLFLTFESPGVDQWIFDIQEFTFYKE